jgi:DNA polymerase-3 subunit epsilon
MNTLNLATLLALTRPLAVVDVETTGLSPENDRIVSIAITMHYPDRVPLAWVAVVNPLVPIPASATAIHGITDEMVKDARPFKAISAGIGRLVNLDFLGFNVPFDLKFIKAEMKRCGQSWDYDDAYLIDAQRIYQRFHPRDLSAAYREYVDPKGLDGAHQSDVDVSMTEQVFAGQLHTHQLPRTVAELYASCADPNNVDREGKIVWRDGVACLSFGKWSGTNLKLVDRSYLDWILTSDFPRDAKAIIRCALNGTYPTQQETT